MNICPHCNEEVSPHQPKITLLTREYHAQCLIEYLKSEKAARKEKEVEEVTDYLYSK